MLPLWARVDLGMMAGKGYSAFPKLQHYWSLTIRLFSVISRTLFGGFLTLCREAVSVFYSPSWLGHITVLSRNCRVMLYYSWSQGLHWSNTSSLNCFLYNIIMQVLTPVVTGGFHTSPSFLGLLADFSSAVVEIVSILPWIFISYNLFSRFFRIIPRASNMVGIPVINILQLFQLLDPGIYPVFYFPFFHFHLLK